MDRESNPDAQSSTERRTFIQSLAAAGAVSGLAGCASSGDEPTDDPVDGGNAGGGNNTDGSNGADGGDDADDGDGSEGNDGGDKTPVKTTYGMAHHMSSNPLDLNYNPSVQPSAADTIYGRLARATGIPDEETGNFIPGIAEAWEYDNENDTFTIEIADTTWWDGDQVTSEDVRDNFLIMSITLENIRNWIDSMETPEEKTLVIHLSGKFNPIILEETFLWTRVARKPSYYEDILEGVEEAESSEDYEQLSEDLFNVDIEDRIGNSIYKHVDATTEMVVAELNEGHYKADQWEGIERFEIYNASDESQRNQRLVQGQVDSSSATLEQGASLPPNSMEQFGYGFHIAGFHINHLSEPLDDRLVRRGLMYLVDREQLSELMDPREFPPVDQITGLNHSQEEMLGEDFLNNKLEQYTYDPNRAEELFNEAGLEKDGDTWLHDGEPWEMSLISHGFGAWIDAGRTFAEILTNQGIDGTFTNVEIAAIGSRIEEGNYDMRVHQASSGVSPLEQYSHDMVGGEAGIRGYPGDPDYAGEVEAPYPIGDPDGNLETVSPKELIDELAQTTDESARMEIRQELSWIYNQTLPALGIGPRFTGNTFRYLDQWEIVNDEDPRYGVTSGHRHFPPMGAIRPKYE